MPTRTDGEKIKIFTLERVQVTAIAVVALVLPLLIWQGLTDDIYTKSIASLVLISGLLILSGITVWQRTSWTIRIPWVLLPVGGVVITSALLAIQATSPLIVA